MLQKFPSLLFFRRRLDPVLPVEGHAAAVHGHQVGRGHALGHRLGRAARAGDDSGLEIAEFVADETCNGDMMNSLCDQVGRNFAIWATFCGWGRNFSRQKCLWRIVGPLFENLGYFLMGLSVSDHTCSHRLDVELTRF